MRTVLERCSSEDTRPPACSVSEHTRRTCCLFMNKTIHLIASLVISNKEEEEGLSVLAAEKRQRKKTASAQQE